MGLSAANQLANIKEKAMTMASTTSELMQDNSSTECISPETNTLATVQNSDLIFGQKHNDIDCALCPTAKRACDRG